MDFTGEDYRLSMLSEETKDLLRNLWVIRGRSLKQWGRFRVFEDIPDQLMQLPINSGIFARFISHRWERTTEPDPRNYQFTSLLPTIQDEEYYWYDYSYKEICETLSLSMSAVKSRMHRARRAMAKRIMERRPKSLNAERIAV